MCVRALAGGVWKFAGVERTACRLLLWGGCKPVEEGLRSCVWSGLLGCVKGWWGRLRQRSEMNGGAGCRGRGAAAGSALPAFCLGG